MLARIGEISLSPSPPSFWAAAPKGTKSCRTQVDFHSSVSSIVRPPPFIRLSGLKSCLSGLKSSLSSLKSKFSGSASQPLLEAGKNKFPLCSTGHRPLRGRCPASPHSNSQSLKAGQRVSLTTYCPWATCLQLDSTFVELTIQFMPEVRNSLFP